MHKVQPSTTAHSSLNPKILAMLKMCDSVGVSINFKLSNLLRERGLTTRDVAKMTGLRLATISDIATGKKGSINLQHVICLMMFFRLTDINDLIEIHIPQEVKELFHKEVELWVNEGEIPKDVKYFSQCINSMSCDKCDLTQFFGYCLKSPKGSH